MASSPIMRLKEVGSPRPDGDRTRCWYSCPTADLYVWVGELEIEAFEFTYGKDRNEHSLRWRAEGVIDHTRIDAGESSPFRNRTPIAIPDGRFDAETVAMEFERVGADVDPHVYRLVLSIVLGELS